ncbi:MAG TPA: cation-transporting P-type ATPase, partial [Candidatus Berkiella sp.]|nr:cation-transporting P-type ATPase [Candidatus Berkiella sp.]
MQTNKNENQEIWYSKSCDKMFEQMRTRQEGLNEEEISQRIKEYGHNALPQAESRSWYVRLWEHLNNVLIWVMLVSSVIAIFLNHAVDAVIIILVVIVNTIIGYIQEGKAEKALEAIQNMVAPHASVLRHGKRISIDARQLVPGDIVLLDAGDRIPADIRLIHAKSLRIDEA